MKPLHFQSRRPVDTYEFQTVTRLRQKGRGWQAVASAIGRTVEDTKRLYAPANAPAIVMPEPERVTVAWSFYEHHRVYAFPDRVDQIVKTVCTRHGVTLEDLKGEGRKQSIAYPRQELMALLMDAGKSTTWVGKFLNRDHTTALYGARVHRARVRRSQEAA